MESKPILKYGLLTGLCALAALALYYSITQSMPRDVDPGQHYDIPGYYNGPMKPRGGNSNPTAEARLGD